ncbi:MAG: ClbS/DfsB family four-helix bundle protein [Chloroflexi bacterium]|nr:ClbS/DfsB family four-helix bundle protein [Chloroflexota bacterium]
MTTRSPSQPTARSRPEDLARLTSTVGRFCQIIERLPARALLEKPWGPRQVLSHLVFWHEDYVRQIEARRAGKGWLLPEGRFAELNARAVASLAGVGVPTLLARFRTANARLCRLAADPASARIPIQVKQDSKSWPLDKFLIDVEAHIRRHGEEIAGAHELRPARGEP